MPPAGSAAWRALRPRMQMVYQDPLGALDRRLPVGVQIMEPLAIHGHGEPGRAARARAEVMDGGRPAAAPVRSLSARAVGRPAPARRAGARADDRARPAGVRRADLRPRRVDPGAGREPAARPAGAHGHRLSLHQPRPQGRAPGQPRGGGDVSRPHRRAGRGREPVRPADASLYARAGLGDPGAADRAASACCCRATRPTRSTCRPAAPSIRAARSRWRSAAPRRLRLRPLADGRQVACHRVDEPALQVAA